MARYRWCMTQWKTSKTSSKDTQLVPCRLFLQGCNLNLETLIDAAGGAAIQGVSIRTGLDKCPVYYGYLLWLKPNKYYITRKGSRLTSAQSSITGLYSIRYSPLHIISS